MEKYTLLTEYKGEYFMDQYGSSNLKDLLYLWFNDLDRKYFPSTIRMQVKEILDNQTYELLQVENMINAWKVVFLSGRFQIEVFILAAL